MYDFSGKIAMVSGGSRGLGRAIATAFIQHGSSVAIAARTSTDVDQTVNYLAELATRSGGDGKVIGIGADLSTSEGVLEFVHRSMEAFGGIDVLVNNVGGSKSGSILDLTDEDILGGWSVKLLGGMRLTRAVVPVMERRGGGSIINIGGSLARDPTPERLLAATTISGVLSFTQAVAPDLARRGIAINVITPGPIRTERLVGLVKAYAKREGLSPDIGIDYLDAKIPTGHVTEPEEIAELTMFLASRRVHNLTGTEIVLNGASRLSI
jgi:3-oxoacyl-[acyl-carrier protein] reductase